MQKTIAFAGALLFISSGLVHADEAPPPPPIQAQPPIQEAYPPSPPPPGPPPAPPPILYAAPPPGYAPPPPGYAPPPPGYAPPPPGYAPPAPVIDHYEERPRYGLLTAGLSVFGGVWSLNAFIAYLADNGRLAIPIAGPMISAYDYTRQHPNDESVNRFVMAFAFFDTLFQAGGVAMAVVGATTHTKVPVYRRVTLVPTLSPTGGGLAAMGRF